MSSILSIEKAGLDQLVAELAARYRVFGPVEVEGVSAWREVRSAEELKLDSLPTDESAKTVFFPQTETVLSYARGEVEAPAGRTRPTAVVGVRPCDARGVLLLDRVFGSGRYQDPGWVRRYRDALIIALGCSRPRSTCFCNRLGSGPFANEGADIMLTDIGTAFIAESTTDNGDKFLKVAYKAWLQRPSDDDLARAGKVRQAALDAMTPYAPRLTHDAGLRREAYRVMLHASWDSPLWDELALSCLGCAACAFLCPTCHCFDVQDETRPGGRQGRRIRMWDWCMSELFTKEASGHNPRPTGGERFRQRVMHKFRYFVESYGEVACTGCGRCIRSCPVGIDIREVLDRLAAEAGGKNSE